MQLALLAPAIQQAILDGTQPEGIIPHRLSARRCPPTSRRSTSAPASVSLEADLRTFPVLRWGFAVSADFYSVFEMIKCPRARSRPGRSASITADTRAGHCRCGSGAALAFVRAVEAMWKQKGTKANHNAEKMVPCRAGSLECVSLPTPHDQCPKRIPIGSELVNQLLRFDLALFTHCAARTRRR